MACYHPISAYKDASGRVHLWGVRHSSEQLQIPCGQCIGCTTARALQWAHRCAHEAKRFDNNLFLTLTYDDTHLPTGGHLSSRDLQLFLKRLRKNSSTTGSLIRSDRTTGIRYFACGEYGTLNHRPHYHAILFNCGFTDSYQVGFRPGRELYESDTLSTLWQHGKASYGAATPKAANYVAQYQLKKRHSPVGLTPPFLRMSNRPAIGTNWLTEFQHDLRHGYLVENGRKYSIPRTYLRTLKRQNPQLHEEITIRTQTNHQTRATETPEQLLAHEQIHTRQQELSHDRTL